MKEIPAFFFFFVLAFALSLASRPAYADLALHYLSHQRLHNPGDRAAAMGGAYTALSDDPSGIYYNPAGIAFAPGHEVSVNVLFSHLTHDTTFKEVVNSEDFREHSDTQFAGLTGGIIQFGRVTVGYGLTTLDNRNINQNDRFEQVSSEEHGIKSFQRIHQEAVTYNLLGGGLAFEISKTWSMGLSVFRYARSIQWMDFQAVQYNDSKLVQLASKVATENNGVLPILGLEFRGSSWSWGISARKGIALADSTDLAIESMTYQSDANDGVPNVQSSEKTTRFYDERNPFTLQSGVAWFPNPNVLVSADVARHEQVPSEGERVALETTYNYAVGAELGVSLLALRLGLFTNNSMFADPSAQSSGTGHAVHVDYLGKSAGLALRRKDIDASLGYVEQTGQGQARIIAADESIQKVEAESRLVFAAARYKF